MASSKIILKTIKTENMFSSQKNICMANILFFEKKQGNDM